MMKSNRAMLFIVCIALFVAIPLVSAATVDVTASGSNDQVILNNAISSANAGDVLRLHGTFVLASTVNLKSGITLLGDGANLTTIYGGTVCGGTSGSQTSGAWLELRGVNNVEISRMTFTSGASGIGDGGHGESRNCMLVSKSTNVRIHDLYFKRYMYNDGVKVQGGSNIYVYNCVAKSVGHDCVEFLGGCKDSAVWNCLIDIQTNTGIRFDNTNNCTAAYITVYGDQGSGWCAFEIEDTITNCRVDHSIVRNLHGSTGNAAVQYVHAKGSLTVSNCVTWDVKSNVAGGSPKLINNKFGASPQSESYWVSQDYGYGAAGATTLPDEIGVGSDINTTGTDTGTSTGTGTGSNYNNTIDASEDTNLTELDLTDTLVNSVEPGTGKYQNVLEFSATTSNGINTGNIKQSVFWFFPDNLMANLYGSGVMGYEPSANVIFSPTVDSSSTSSTSSTGSNIIVPITTSQNTQTVGTPTATSTTTVIASPTNTTTVTTTTTTTTITTTQLQNIVNSLIVIQPKAYN